ncbi:MAG: hypothetical protein IJN18_03185 [Clostridia bacterium]|nr:hypothetical protein [Clostridia bacterium]MBQ6711309.1 hypothetical protein [Clostridia bacterium]
MPAEHRFYDKGTFLIAVDRYHRGEMSGAFYHPVRRESGTFASLIQLLLQMEQSMDQENLPQSFHAPRSFAPYRGFLWAGDACRFISGREATFVVNIRFRRNSSWQGEVFYQKDSRPRPFRSVLELIGLMDSLMEGRAAPPMELAE